MLKATPTFTPEWWTPPSEEGKAQPTRFLLRGLSGLHHHEASMFCEYNRYGVFVIPERSARIAIDNGVLDVQNLDGYDPQKLLSAQLPSNPVNLIGIVAHEVMRRSVLEDEEKKDSASPPKSGETPESSTASTAAGDDTATPTTADRAAAGALDLNSGV